MSGNSVQKFATTRKSISIQRILKTRIYFILNKKVSPPMVLFPFVFSVCRRYDPEWRASLIWYKNPSFTQPFRHISTFLTFLTRAASRRLVHDEPATNPHNLSVEKREINSLRSESRLVWWYRKTGSFFFQPFVNGARKGYVCYAYRHVHYTREHSQG